jgi:hypothetical protein
LYLDQRPKVAVRLFYPPLPSITIVRQLVRRARPPSDEK